MKRIARLIGLFSILLVLFVTALVVSQRSLQRQTERLRLEAIAQKQRQFAAIVELAEVGPPPWPEHVTNALERALDARIRSGSFESAETASRVWQFNHAFAPDAAERLVVSFDPPPGVRLLSGYQTIAATLLILALGAIVVFSAFLLWSIRTRDTAEDSAAVEREHAQAGFQNLQQLASISVQQGAELERERAGRLRVEEDLNLKQRLLNHALEQKIRLGQDLHDGIIQSLYATGLTLEAARAQIARDPAAADERLAGVTQALNTTIRDVRAYINGLSPETLRRQTLPEAIDLLTRDLGAGRTTAFSVSIDPRLAAGLSDELGADILQIVREAVSNSLRHGAASQIAIALVHDGSGLKLSITDDGPGLPVRLATPAGHGLENMRSRAQRYSGSVSIESVPDRGATVTCRIPTLKPPSQPS